MITFVLFFVSVSVYAKSPIAKMCYEASVIGGILGPWSAQIFQGITLLPPPATPVANIGFSQITINESPFFEVCRLMQRLDKMEGSQKIFAVADFANKMSGNQYNEGLNLTKDIFGVADSLYTANKKGNLKSDLLSKRRAVQINRVLGNINQYYKSNNDDSIEALNTRGQQEIQLRKIARTTKRRSELQNYLRCPKKVPIDKKKALAYQDVMYQNQYYIDQFTADIKYLDSQLIDMGIEMSSTEKEYVDYLKLYKKAYAEGVVYRSQFSRKNYNQTVTAKNGKSQETKLVKKIQKITVRTNPSYFQVFKAAYTSKWKNYTKASLAIDHSFKGALTRGSAKVDDQWTDKIFECREHKFAYALSRSGNYQGLSDPRLRADARARKKACLSNSNNYQFENIFNRFVVELQRIMFLKKTYQADLWSRESEVFGTMRNVSYTQVEFQNTMMPNESVRCSEKLNSAQITEATAELNAINAENREMLLNNKIQIGMRHDAKISAQRRRLEESRRRRVLERQRSQRRTEAQDQIIGMPTTSGY